MKYYKLNINSLTKEDYERIFQEVDEYRQKKWNNLKQEEDKKRCLAVHELITKTLKEELNMNNPIIDYSSTPKIKNSDYHISISHCNEWVVLGLSKKKIGIDIEKIKAINWDITRFFCSEDDLLYIKKNNKRFYKVWTFKEAYCKANNIEFSRKIKEINFKDYKKEYDLFDQYLVCLYEE